MKFWQLALTAHVAASAVVLTLLAAAAASNAWNRRKR